MYRNIDGEVFLAPETIVAGVLATAEFDDAQDLTAAARVPRSWHVAEAAADGPGAYADREAEAAAAVRAGAASIDAWSRHARGASGFGG
jgi:predicted transcriptional regulator